MSPSGFGTGTTSEKELFSTACVVRVSLEATVNHRAQAQSSFLVAGGCANRAWQWHTGRALSPGWFWAVASRFAQDGKDEDSNPFG